MNAGTEETPPPLVEPGLVGKAFALRDEARHKAEDAATVLKGKVAGAKKAAAKKAVAVKKVAKKKVAATRLKLAAAGDAARAEAAELRRAKAAKQ